METWEEGAASEKLLSKCCAWAAQPCCQQCMSQEDRMADRETSSQFTFNDGLCFRETHTGLISGLCSERRAGLLMSCWHRQLWPV